MRKAPVSGLCVVVCLGLTLSPLQATEVPVTVTAYTWSGLRTASGKWPAPGMLALSRDLEDTLGVKFGQNITLEGLGRYVFECRMHRRWQRRADIFVPTWRQARRFGKRRSVLLKPSDRLTP